MTVIPVFVAAALLLAGHSPHAFANTMSKCVDANGKISYSDQPCPGEAKLAREFTIAAPEQNADRDALKLVEKARLRAAESAFRERHASRDQELDATLRHGEYESRQSPAEPYAGSPQAEQRRAGVPHGSAPAARPSGARVK
jgi:hypothetical protein